MHQCSLVHEALHGILRRSFTYRFLFKGQITCDSREECPFKNEITFRCCLQHLPKFFLVSQGPSRRACLEKWAQD